MKLPWKPGDQTLKIGNVLIDLLGDPHMGRAFRHGVPLHRLGEREAMQRELFRKRVMDTKADLHVCMGDIFDKFVVSPTVVLFAARVYREAAEKNPDTFYVILRGNHDGSRDASHKSSFDLLEALLVGIDNLEVVSDISYGLEIDGRYFGFIPWHPFKDAASMVDEFISTMPIPDADVVFGHWDVEDFGGENPNLIPVEGLSQITNLAVTGHVHKPERRDIDGLDVIVTGSMMPLAHGEDLNNETYRIVDLATARKLVEDGEATNLCLRVILEDKEELDFEIDCLQLQVQKKSVDIDDVKADFGNFDMKKLFEEVFAENAVSSQVTTEIWTRLKSSNPDIV